MLCIFSQVAPYSPGSMMELKCCLWGKDVDVVALHLVLAGHYWSRSTLYVMASYTDQLSIATENGLLTVLDLISVGCCCVRTPVCSILDRPTGIAKTVISIHLFRRPEFVNTGLNICREHYKYPLPYLSTETIFIDTWSIHGIYFNQLTAIDMFTH